jgi:hypothetical protein
VISLGEEFDKIELYNILHNLKLEATYKQANEAVLLGEGTLCIKGRSIINITTYPRHDCN